MQSFTITGRLDGLNELINANRMNRYEGAKRKRAYTELCAWSARAARIRKPGRFPVMVWIHWIEPNSRRDPDNIASGKKYILDGLMSAGVLPNDGPKQIRGFLDTFGTDQREPRIIVRLYEDGEPLPWEELTQYAGQ